MKIEIGNLVNGNVRRMNRHIAPACVAALLVVAMPAPLVAQETPKAGTYEIYIPWSLTGDGKEVKLGGIQEGDRGDLVIFRDISKGLKIEAKVIAPHTVQFRLKKVSLIVEDKSEPRFTVASLGVDIASNPVFSKNQMEEMNGATYPLTETQQLLLFDTVFTQTIPEDSEGGEARVTYQCETCAPNPSCLGLD